MKRNLLLLAVMVVAALFFATNSWAQTNDLGRPDSLMVKTVACDHTYEGAGGYDSVRVSITVSHDSNTFYWEEMSGLYQDSISSMVIPLTFWHQPAGHADSVILPTYGNWNNTVVDAPDEGDPDLRPRSVFRDIVCGGTTPCRMRSLKWETRILNIESHSSDGDSGHAWFSLIAGSSKKKWAEGSNVLLATLTFLVYKNPAFDTTEIGIDTIQGFDPPAGLLFVRYDASGYVPVAVLPVKDTIYIVPDLPPDIACPSNDTIHKQDYVGQFSVTDFENCFTSVTYTMTPAFGGIVTVNPASGTPPWNGTFTYTPDCVNDKGKTFTVWLIATEVHQLKDSCSFTITVTNGPPTLTCPPNADIHRNHTQYVGNFTYGDPESDDVAITLGTNPTIPAVLQYAGGTGTVTWTPNCQDIGPFTLTLTAVDQCSSWAVPCSWQLTTFNNPPSCDLDCPDTMTAEQTKTIDFTATDTDGDLITLASSASCGTAGTPNPSSGHGPISGSFPYKAPLVTVPSTCTIYLTVTDTCNASSMDSCIVVILPKPPGLPNEVRIPNKVYERFGFGHWDYLWPQDPDAGNNCIVFDERCPGWAGINPGDYFEIPIILSRLDEGVSIGGFELEVDFDYIDLTFYGASRGGLLEFRDTERDLPPPVDSIFWSWEYFSYRVLPCATCACCKYKILLYGQAEMPDGQFRRGYCLTETEDPVHPMSTFWYEDEIKAACPGEQVIDHFATLAWLKFQVANNELLRDLKLPIVFEWEAKFDPNPPYHMLQDWDCAENTMSNCDGSKLYVSSNDTLQYDPDVCLGDPLYVKNILNFVDGGVHICSPCTAFTCVRGDINYDDVPYSTADAVLFARYFVYGLQVFTIDRDEQVCATDINADGRTLMLADLIYLIRVIQRDAVAFPKLGPSSDVVNVIVSDGRITVECASAIGGILFKFDGNVTPTLLNANMELLSNEGNVLVWSSAGHSINAGASQLLTASGELVSVIAVDREGRDLATTITTKLAPSTFALHPAYPNPFNPNTNLSFSLPTAVSYSLNIYNVAGQLVRSYQGMGNVGSNVITWNGKDNAGNDVSSGVYFYKLIAGSYTATNKMVMMK